MQGKGEGKRSAAVQFKTMDGPLLTQSCKLQSIQPTGFPSRLHISWLKWHKTFPYQVKATDFPGFHSSNTEQERLTNRGLLATLAARPQCVFTQGRRKKFWKIHCWVLPLCHTPQSSAVCWIKLCCSVGDCHSFLHQTRCFFWRDT